jgi:hypothetical protein
MYQQLWGYKVEEKLYLGVREQKRFNTTVLEHMLCLMLFYNQDSDLNLVFQSETAFQHND